MIIKVFSERTIKNFKTDKNYAIISIQDPSCDFVKLYKPKNCKAILKFKFYDLDKKIGQENYDNWLFESKDAKHILNAINLLKDKIDILCVHCVAGVSRSAGVAGALSKILNNDDMYYFKNYCPNMLVYRTILKEYYEEK